MLNNKYEHQVQLLNPLFLHRLACAPELGEIRTVSITTLLNLPPRVRLRAAIPLTATCRPRWCGSIASCSFARNIWISVTSATASKSAVSAAEALELGVTSIGQSSF